MKITSSYNPHIPNTRPIRRARLFKDGIEIAMSFVSSIDHAFIVLKELKPEHQWSIEYIEIEPMPRPE